MSRASASAGIKRSIWYLSGLLKKKATIARCLVLNQVRVIISLYSIAFYI